MRLEDRKGHACPECGQIHVTPEQRRQLNVHHTECARCGGTVGDNYVLKDEVRLSTGMGKYDGVLHLACVEKLIGRELTLDDFKPNVRSNTGIEWAWNRGRGER